MEPQERYKLLLDAALRIARKPKGWLSLSRSGIAKEAQCSYSCVKHHLGSITEIRDLLIKMAFEHGYQNLVDQIKRDGHRKPMSTAERERSIRNSAVAVARRPGGWQSLTRAAIAAEAQCAEGLVSLYLGSMEEARRKIMKSAIKHEHLDLIAQGIASGHPLCAKLSPVLKHKAVSCLIDLGE